MEGKRIRSMILTAAALTMLASGCGENGQSGNMQDAAGITADAGQEGQASGQQPEESQGTAEQEEGQDGEAEASGQKIPEGYQFLAGDVVLVPDMDIEDVLPLLGESKSVFEAPSCAGQGMSYIYDYVSYEIETYPAADGVNRIGYIVLKDDTVSTPEGIDLSMGREDCISVYGEASDETESKLTFIRGNMKLNFILEGDNIISIEYASAVIG